MRSSHFYITITFIITSFSSFAQWNGWMNPTPYTMSKPVNLLHVKDITGDEKPDLVGFFTASEPYYAFLKGMGNGRFSAQQEVSKEDNYHLSDLADFNKDGLPDMVISSYWNNGFKIYLGKGNGQFREGVYMNTGVHGRNIKCVDINKDGNPDIVATTSGSGHSISLHVFLGKGDGNFHPKQTYTSVLDTCKEIFITDKNSDGLLDVIVSSSFPWFVMFLQQPNGSFEPRYQPTYTTAQLAFNDLDHDGREDAILMYSSFDNNPESDSIVIRVNTGDSSYATGKRLNLLQEKGIRPALFRVADINKDGYTDILFNHLDAEGYTTDTAFYMLGKANLEFDQPMSLIMPDRIIQMQLADLNNDDYPEWIISCANGRLYVINNGGNEQANPKLAIEVAPNPAKGIIKLRTAITSSYKVNLYSTDGRFAKAWKFTTKVNDLDITGLSSGMYFLEVINKNERIVKAIVVQQ